MNWLFTSFRTGRRMQQLLGMVGLRQRRNNNRSLMLSIVGLGLGAAAVTMMRGRDMNMNNMMEPVKEAVGDMDFRNPIG
ncbi:hypothetical protein BKP35_01530 [Anaerobacillus arseniciselenatis]|uniref:Uncharacterized protein n=1 Tax=Anaerobacillus arseniciselenatis TaxID=85682 RepID=A0A1S2LT56_9BACI|nr:hypothetical protein [Anaerobacillus arseniciselenatis]OIJ15701.1 hypothetical protein BKP35_01530 [Anaerobacillus arseniciselenatis]